MPRKPQTEKKPSTKKAPTKKTAAKKKPVAKKKPAAKKVAAPKTPGKRGRPPLPKIKDGTPNPCANALRKLRKDSGLSLEEFGDKVGMAGPAIARLESEKYYSASMSTLITIAEKLGMTVSIAFRKGKK